MPPHEFNIGREMLTYQMHRREGTETVPQLNDYMLLKIYESALICTGKVCLF